MLTNTWKNKSAFWQTYCPMLLIGKTKLLFSSETENICYLHLKYTVDISASKSFRSVQIKVGIPLLAGRTHHR